MPEDSNPEEEKAAAAFNAAKAADKDEVLVDEQPGSGTGEGTVSSTAQAATGEDVNKKSDDSLDSLINELATHVDDDSHEDRDQDVDKEPEYASYEAFTEEAAKILQTGHKLKWDLEDIQNRRNSLMSESHLDAEQQLFLEKLTEKQVDAFSAVNAHIKKIDKMGETNFQDQDEEGFYNSLTTIKTSLELCKSNFFKLMTSTSDSEIKENIADLVEDGAVTQEQADNLIDRLSKTMNDITYDNSLEKLCELNEGSSLDTFLAFLSDPVRTTGRDGNRLKFGTEEIDGENVEVMPLPLFREKFRNTEDVAKALEKSAKNIDEGWASKNSDALSRISKAHKTDPEKEKAKVELKGLLALMVKELFIDDSSKAAENKKNFKLHFGSELMKGGSKVTLDETSFKFFIDLMINDGSKLDTFWNIAS